MPDKEGTPEPNGEAAATPTEETSAQHTPAQSSSSEYETEEESEPPIDPASLIKPQGESGSTCYIQWE